jgi:quinol monooxygenase YgiN
MYVNLRRYEIHPDKVDEMVKKVKEGLVPIFKAKPGFVSYDLCVIGTGVILAITKFEDKADAHDSREEATKWIEANAKEDLPNPPMVMAGEVRISV